MNKPYAIFDRSRFPIVKVEFTGLKADDENFRDYLEELLKSYDSKENLVIIFDALKASFPGMQYQKEQAAWMKEHDSLIRKYCKAIAYVVSSPGIRIALRLIFMFQNNPVPFKVFKNVKDGIEWSKYRLDIEEPDKKE